jgi:hypothetical protein
MLLDERFTGGAGDEWSRVEGWTLVGYARGTSWSAAGPAFAWYAEGEGWVDYAVALDGRIDAGGLAIGVRAGPDGRYVVHAGATVVALLREAPWGSFEVLAAAPPLEAERTHALSVAVVAGRIQVWSDGRLILAHSDLDPLRTGTVTLGAGEGSVVSVDGVRISALGAPLPPVNPANAGAEPIALPVSPDAAPPGGPLGDETAEVFEPQEGNDLELGLVRFDRSRYTTGDPITVEVAVRLAGEGPVGPFGVRFEVGDTGCEATVQSLSNFGSATAVCTAPGIGQSGLPVWHVEVDDRSQVAESDEQDNSAVGALVVSDAGRDADSADLVAMWWSTDPWPPDPDEPVDLQFRVGPLPPFDGDLPAYVVTVSLDGAALCAIEVVSPDPTTVTCPLDTGFGAGRHVLGLVVDATGVVDEGPGEAGNSVELVVDL